MNDFHSGLAGYLIQDGLLASESLQQLQQNAQQQKIPLITHLVRENILDSKDILNCCKKYFDYPITHLTQNKLSKDILSTEFILRYRTLPLAHDLHTLQIAISDPTDTIAIDALKFHTNLNITPHLTCEKTLDKILSELARTHHFGTTLEPEITEEIRDKNNEDDGPVSEFVTRLLDDAIAQHASDIHIEPFTKHTRIRFRRDGLLYEVTTLPSHFATRLITRLKILSHLNIAERRLPQDGRLFFQYNNMDIRINTCPTLSGEKIVLRLLDANKIKLDIDVLGFTPEQKKLFLEKIYQPQGLILVTGPTGSGKTITLYSAINYLNTIEKNISSVEDPVEMEFSGINQININPRIGLNFPTILRTLLRQDPDIIMIGEIRDAETAEIAVQAAQTGHLVLSTLHTNSAIETIARLQSMGIKSHHFISSISLIIAQRLVRKLCVHCKSQNLKPETGCDHCHQGYHGRIGIFECLPMTKTLASKILSGADFNQLQKIMRQEKWISLHEASEILIKNGITTHEEIYRVLGKN